MFYWGWQGGVSALKCITILLWSRVMWKGYRSFLIAEILTHKCHYAITKQRCHGNKGQSIFIIVKAHRKCSFDMSPLPTVKFWSFCSSPPPPLPSVLPPAGTLSYQMYCCNLFMEHFAIAMIPIKIISPQKKKCYFNMVFSSVFSRKLSRIVVNGG